MPLERRYLPPKALDSIFTHFYEATNGSQQSYAKQLFPSLQTKLVLDLGTPTPFTLDSGNQAEIEKYMIIGPSKRVIKYNMVPASHIFVANFNMDGFYRLFSCSPPRRLTREYNQFQTYHPCILDLHQQLQNEPDPQNYLAILSQICLQYLSRRHPVADLLDRPIANNLSPIKSVARQTSLSERHLQTIHKAQFGFTAKEALRYRRFSNLIKYMELLSVTMLHRKIQRGFQK
ncbi:hypothetical protein [Dyadobacter tibetensis]|uniref:hypothetical protein n=1 Tax=Dyadobacter tibetensis TaxID=1211851 RepID=UPI000470B30B|nr:hypothetical protein [Dyadobacter tibetensis]